MDDDEKVWGETVADPRYALAEAKDTLTKMMQWVEACAKIGESVGLTESQKEDLLTRLRLDVTDDVWQDEYAAALDAICEYEGWSAGDDWRDKFWGKK